MSRCSYGSCTDDAQVVRLLQTTGEPFGFCEPHDPESNAALRALYAALSLEDRIALTEDLEEYAHQLSAGFDCLAPGDALRDVDLHLVRGALEAMLQRIALVLEKKGGG